MHTVEKVSLSIVGILLSILFLVCNYQSNQMMEENRIAIQQKWNSWVSYRDKNCKLIEHLYGLSVSSGKMTFKDNANKYVCSNGQTYIISQSRDNGKGDLTDIPNIK